MRLFDGRHFSICLSVHSHKTDSRVFFLFVVFNFDQILSIFFLNTTVSFVGFVFFQRNSLFFVFHTFFVSLSLSLLEKESERESSKPLRVSDSAHVHKKHFSFLLRERKRECNMCRMCFLRLSAWLDFVFLV